MNPQMMAQALQQYQALPPGATAQPDLMGTPAMPSPAPPMQAAPVPPVPMQPPMPPAAPPVAMMGGGPANGMGMRPMSQAPGVRPF